MKSAVAILGLLLLGGCTGRTDYSVYADGRRPTLSRIASLDARLCGLLGDEHPDSTKVLRIVDTLRSKMIRGRTEGDSASRYAVGRTLTEIGIEPVLHPGDSDLVPSLAWSRRKAGCVPLVLFWIHALRAHGIETRPALLPGHLAISWEDHEWIETLRGGTPRNKSFYDSAFRLEQRPYYRNLDDDPDAILSSMLVHAGLMEWKKGHGRNAESAFRAATEISPGMPEAEGNLGLVLEELGNATESVKRLEIALQGDPLAIQARTRLDRRTQEE